MEPIDGARHRPTAGARHHQCHQHLGEMMKGSIGIRGMITVRVLDSEGNIKREAPGFFRRVFGIAGRQMLSRHHNIVTKQGDALIADALLATRKKVRVTSNQGFVQVGTGWTGVNAKENIKCNAPTGVLRLLDEVSPVLSASFGHQGDNVLTYKATFPPGDLIANGINEAVLLNARNEPIFCLAYGQITPAVNVTETDILQIIWQITIEGK